MFVIFCLPIYRPKTGGAMSSVMGNISNSFMLEMVSAPLFYVIYEFCYGKHIKQFHVGDGE